MSAVVFVGAITALAVAASVALLGYLLATPIEVLTDVIPDDSFFYLRIAQFLGAGEGFSFDGFTTTYGFQPLWQLVCGLCSLVVDGEPRRLFYLVLGLCVLLHVGTGVLLALFAKRWRGGTAGVLAFALWTLPPPLIVWSCGLKENVLFAFLLALAALQLEGVLRREASRPAHFVRFGVTLGLMCFARVNALIPVLVLLFTLLALPRRVAYARVSMTALSGLAAAVVAAPWYVFAKLYFGSALPTSGITKFIVAKAHVEGVWKAQWLSVAHVTRALQEVPGQVLATARHAFGDVSLVLAALGLVAGAGLLVLRRRAATTAPDPRPKNSSAAWVLAALVSGAFFACLANVMFLAPYLGYARWYTVPEYLAIVLALSATAATLLRFVRVAPGIALLVTVAVLALAAFVFERPRLVSPLPRDYYTRAPTSNQQLVEAGLWAAQHVPDDMRVGIWDPGIVSFFSQKRLTSLDPLMNSLDYQQRAIADQVAYCREQGIAHVFGSTIRWPDGKLGFTYLMPGTNDVLWQPWPEQPLGWTPTNPWWTVVKLRSIDVGPRFADTAFAFGYVRPNDEASPRRAPGLDAELARWRRGLRFEADVLRIAVDDAVRTDDGASITAPRLRIGDRIEELNFDADGWCRRDLRAYRGLELQLLVDDDQASRVRDLQVVDY